MIIAKDMESDGKANLEKLLSEGFKKTGASFSNVARFEKDTQVILVDNDKKQKIPDGVAIDVGELKSRGFQKTPWNYIQLDVYKNEVGELILYNEKGREIVLRY